MLKKILIAVSIVLVLLIGGTWYWLHSLLPVYDGNQSLKGLKEKTEVYYDKLGVPHIYAASETDAYFSLGYVVAQDRLFQLEMIRRLAGGRLAEILGSSMLKSDKFFRTIGLNKHAEWSEAEFRKNAPANIQASTDAYIAGVNAYIENGTNPFEFTVLGIEKEPFKLKDVYLIIGYMALGFAEGFRIDPMVEGVYRKVGDVYMNELELGWPKGSTTIPVTGGKPLAGAAFSSEVSALIDLFPVAPWMGSNSWVLAPSRTKSKSTILCNDTHMGYTQPAIWYEAHIEYPGFKHYGNYIAGLPFALVGHNDFCGNGLTMFENDDTDFYIEKVENDKVLYKNEWKPLVSRSEKIIVKDGNEVNLKINETPHGPLIQDVFEDFPLYQQSVSVWWNFLKFPARSLEAVYGINHSKSMDDARSAAAMIDAPGLNVMYGDKDGHIAWWAAAKLVKRREGLMSKRFLNGASGNDDPLGYFTFDENPKSEDPVSGFVYSANNQPDSCAVGLYPGYYVPEDRALKISSSISAKTDWDIDACKQLMVNTSSAVYPKTAKHLLNLLKTLNSDALSTEAANRLSSWEGEHGLESVGPVIYYRWIYNILYMGLRDEMGDELFKGYMNSHLMKTSYPVLLYSFESKWWDNQSTREVENRNGIVTSAWKQTIDDLSRQLGKEVSGWRWKEVHTLEHKHPVGRQKPFDYFLNVGPTAISGGNEVVNNLGFSIDSSGEYKVQFGPSMRRIIDFSNPETSFSVLPTGQSGYFMAPHYDDQFTTFNSSTFRNQLMKKEEIVRQAGKPLILEPAQ